MSRQPSAVEAGRPRAVSKIVSRTATLAALLLLPLVLATGLPARRSKPPRMRRSWRPRRAPCVACSATGSRNSRGIPFAAAAHRRAALGAAAAGRALDRHA